MDIKTLTSRYRTLSMLMKIIVINAVVFLSLHIVAIVAMFSGAAYPQSFVVRAVEMPSYLPDLLCRPWTVLTYMFAQYDVMHFIFNMLWLYWFGTIFLMLSTPRRVLGLYILGGLGGALLYVVSYNLLPFFSGIHGLLIGSSASVIAIVTATAFIAPDYRMNLLLFGAVSLKWVAIVTIAIDLISVTGANAGGHIAHLGGAVVGALYGLQMRRGRDITAPLNALIDGIVNLFKHRRRPTAASGPQRTSQADDRKALDDILDKIKKSGYTSLTAEERRRLFEVSSRIK